MKTTEQRSKGEGEEASVEEIDKRELNRILEAQPLNERRELGFRVWRKGQGGVGVA